jgi:hypothetical protein
MYPKVFVHDADSLISVIDVDIGKKKALEIEEFRSTAAHESESNKCSRIGCILLLS